MMTGDDGLRARLLTQMSGADSALAAADALCVACAALLDVDGAWISLSDTCGQGSGTFGASSDLSRRLDDLQFTYGEGPGPSAVRTSRPVLAPDLRDRAENRWPVFRDAVLRSGVAAVFAWPVSIATRPIGAIGLFRRRAGPLAAAAPSRALVVAQLAALPLLELISSDASRQRSVEAGGGRVELSSGARADVYRATGMLMEAMGIGPAEALLRLRAHAVAQGRTAAEVAATLLERRLPMDPADWSDGRSPPP